MNDIREIVTKAVIGKGKKRHAHPTQSEALGEAFLALAGKPLHAL